MKPIQSVLIAAAFPERLNSNLAILKAMAEGLRAALPPGGQVTECRFHEAAAAAAAIKPDVLLLVGSCMPDVVQYEPVRAACDATGARLAFWLHDDPYEFDTNYRACEVADVIFSNDRWAARHYDHPRVFHLPLAASPAHFRAPDQTRYIDLFFCGVAFQNRIDLLRDMEGGMKNFRPLVLGDNWPTEVMPYCRNERLSNARFADLCAVSLATLNVGRHFNLVNRRYDLVSSTPGPRTFETAMAAGVQLVFVESLEIVDYFEPGEEILLFDHPDEAGAMLEKLSKDRAWAEAIARAAQRRAQAEHLYAHRARRILELTNGC